MKEKLKQYVTRISSAFQRESTVPPVKRKGEEISARIVSGKTLLQNEIEEVPMLLGYLLPKSGIAVLSGSSDTGKSSLMRQFAIGIVTGRDKFLGFDLYTEHRRVCYVCSEDDEFSLSPRINAYAGQSDHIAPEQIDHIKVGPLERAFSR
jgi:RecA-family ATPase